MHFQADHIYHIYNRGNNKQQIFFAQTDYESFLHYVKRFITPHSNILAWCLMPNHFHFLIHCTKESVETRKYGGLQLTILSYSIKQLLSSYTKSINKTYNRTGNLFQQKTKAKCVNDINGNYCRNAFFYIHQNPLKANLITDILDWKYSSFKEVLENSSSGLTCTSLIQKIVDVDIKTFETDIYNIITAEEERLIL
jgi:putative transposase